VRTRKPTLRITKWLQRVPRPGPRIPLEAECTACADAQFKIKHDKRLPFGAVHQPRSDWYAEMLQRAFDEHVKLVHPDETAKTSFEE
jgi:hypothetical protein